MRRQTPIAHQLYAYLFPHPAPNDPPNFSAHLARNLVPEVRIEVATFYGDLNSAEARYPGLNYCYPAHRMRLGRFKHHRRLFEAFDTLGLTYNEIQDFCCWEGTRWARERYEKDEGVKVVDTTGDEIGPYVDRRELRAAAAAADERRRKSITRQTDISVIVEEAATLGRRYTNRHRDLQNAPHHRHHYRHHHQQQQQQQILQQQMQQHPTSSDPQDSEMSDAESAPEQRSEAELHPTTDVPEILDTSMPDHHNQHSQAPLPSTSSSSSLISIGSNINTASRRIMQSRHRPSPAETTRRRREETLNRQLIAAWEQGYNLSPELEQWLKEQSERGTLMGVSSSSSSGSVNGMSSDPLARFVGAATAAAGAAAGAQAGATGAAAAAAASTTTTTTAMAAAYAARGLGTSAAFRAAVAATQSPQSQASQHAQQQQQQSGVTSRAAA